MKKKMDVVDVLTALRGGETPKMQPEGAVFTIGKATKATIVGAVASGSARIREDGVLLWTGDPGAEPNVPDILELLGQAVYMHHQVAVNDPDEFHVTGAVVDSGDDYLTLRVDDIDWEIAVTRVGK